MIVIGDHQNKRVAARLGPIAHQPDHIIEHDGVVDRPLHVEQMRVLVDHAGLHHEEEAGLVPGKHVERRTHLLGQVRLLGKFRHRPALEEFAVERAVHVTEREQAKQSLRFWRGGERVHFRTSQRNRVT